MAECAVQLSGFKNVDLFSQGVYQVRVRAYADRSGRAAVPFALTELPLPPLPGSVNSEQLLPAHLVGRERSCCPERRSSPPPDSHGWLWVAEARASASANERGALRSCTSQAHIQDGTGDACTHAFRVRYCDEEVAMRLLARFRVELRLVAGA